jgi:hypothetical protein
MTEDKVDMRPTVDAELPTLLALSFDDAVSGLHDLERRTRLAKDDPSNIRVCETIVKLCIEQHRWEDLGANISLLARRRGYSRTAISNVVTLAWDALPENHDLESKLALVKVLRDVTEGKIFVEVQRARLTELLVQDLESKGGRDNLVEAANLLHELRLEILSSMDEPERMRLMLHQFRLCLDTGDSLRSSLCAEKIPDLKDADPELKSQFLLLQIQYHSQFTQDYLAKAESYHKLFELNSDPGALTDAIVNAVLAVHSEKQVSFCSKLQELKELTLMPDAKSLLGVFRGMDLVPWAEFEPKFPSLIPQSDPERSVMRQRVIEHSLRVVAAYYTKIRLQRLAELEQISVDELEQRIIDLVFNEGFYARIDRPRGIITFKRKQQVGEVADEFSDTVMRLCKLVDQAHSLIEKERQRIQRPRIV